MEMYTYIPIYVCVSGGGLNQTEVNKIPFTIVSWNLECVALVSNECEIVRK